MSRLKHTLFFFLLFVLTSFGLQLLQTHSASALSGSEFQPGRIIDDVVFNDKNRMNAGQIQEFLNAKVPVCDTNGTQMYNNTQTRAQWAAANGRPLPPYTCLKDYSQSVPTIINGGSDLCKSSISGGSKTAAQIIYDVAQACNVNPQVLIVLLQKEQSLITDTWPWPNQYQSATGYGCPDTAPCDAEFYGFFNQVYQAAKAFRRYEANPNSYNYKANRNNYIYYHPSLGACGGTNVFIQNQATASLYIYTPYQPNAAALSNLYGTGDGCSAYGNRNFWRMFNDWFGSTLTDGVKASVTTFFVQTKLKASQKTQATLAFKNEGSQTWPISGAKSVKLATTNPINRASHFSHGWPSLARPTSGPSRVLNSDGSVAGDQTKVLPTQMVEFKFDISVPIGTKPGTYREWFEPILEGAPVWWMNAQTYIDVTVEPTSFSAQPVKNTSNITLKASQQAIIVKSFRNTGNIDWFNDLSSEGVTRPVRLAVTSPINKSSQFSNNWYSPSRPLIRATKVYKSDGITLSANQNIVAPGQIAEYEFPVYFPLTLPTGYYSDDFQLILEGASEWWLGGLTKTTYNILPTIISAQPTTNSTSLTLNNANPTRTVSMTYRNTGNIDWFTDNHTSSSKWFPVRIATSNAINRQSTFTSNLGWISSGRISSVGARVYKPDSITLADNQNIVGPGMYLQIDFNIHKNTNGPGQYVEDFELIQEGSPIWWMGPSTRINITVN